MADHALHETVRLLSRLGKGVFSLGPPGERFPRCADSPIDALKLFLYGYAFEHQGRSPAYGELAVKALGRLSVGCTVPVHAESLARKLWKKFCELGQFPDGKGANPKNNPLCPCPGRGEDRSRDVVSVAFSSEIEPDGHNLYHFACRSVVSDQVSKAHAALQRIRGVGPKIASLFLRDVALDRSLPDVHLRDRHLLQPIDVWLRRTTALLTEKSLNDEEAARQIVQLADEAECCALSLNFGSWYFGSQIVRREQSLDEALKSPNSVRCLVEEYRARLEKEAALLKQISG
jgi:hypothetical protein